MLGWILPPIRLRHFVFEFSNIGKNEPLWTNQINWFLTAFGKLSSRSDLYWNFSWCSSPHLSILNLKHKQRSEIHNIQSLGSNCLKKLLNICFHIFHDFIKDVLQEKIIKYTVFPVINTTGQILRYRIHINDGQELNEKLPNDMWQDQNIYMPVHVQLVLKNCKKKLKKWRK